MSAPTYDSTYDWIMGNIVLPLFLFSPIIVMMAFVVWIIASDLSDDARRRRQ